MSEIIFGVAVASVSCWGLVCLSHNPVERHFYALCGAGLAGLLFWLLILA